MVAVVGAPDVVVAVLGAVLEVGDCVAVGPEVVGVGGTPAGAGAIGDSSDVLVVVGVVVRGRSRTEVRGTQVYSGSGTKPGGTSCVSVPDGVGAGGW